LKGIIWDAILIAAGAKHGAWNISDWNNFFKTKSILGAGVGREAANLYNALWPIEGD
jgi:hypothetical protein